MMSIDSIAVVVSSIHVNVDTGEAVGICMGIVSICSETAVGVVTISISK